MKPYYDDGQCVIYHGDCLEVTAWAGADVLVTDPPYGINHSSNREGAWRDAPIANDGDTDVREAALRLWGIKPAIIFGSWKRPRPSGVRTVLIWDKGLASGMGDLSLPWKPNWEEIYVLGRGFSGKRSSGVISGHNVVTWASKGRCHPNMKPTGLLCELIAKCPPGAIADPFMGSGATILAAQLLGRKAIGIEIEERYCEIAAKRLQQGVLLTG